MSAAVLSGFDLLVAEKFKRLKGRRVAILAHQPSVDGHYRHLVDVIADQSDIEIVRLFAPEHGFYGDAQDQVALSKNSRLRDVDVVNLYGESFDSLWPPDQAFDQVDLLLVDIQDVGSRYYTYFATLAFCLERAAKKGIAVCVLDRPNPLGGEVLEGGYLEAAMKSFVGWFRIPVRHGMTVGELARWVNEQEGYHADLDVVEMVGWRRSMAWEYCGLPWVMPSPNMPTPDTARVYPGACLLEGTNISEGRGTTRPFELFGSPWLDTRELTKRLAADKLPGVRFRETAFLPQFHKYAGTVCRALQLHVTDSSLFRSWLTYIRILTHVAAIHEQFDWYRGTYEFVTDRLAIDLLLGDSRLRRAIEDQESVDFFRDWEQNACKDFSLSRHFAIRYAE